jgi:hypothetical protein
MSEYKHENGFTYTQQELDSADKNRVMSIDEYISSSPLKLINEVDDGNSVDWFSQTWFGRGYDAASTTGEASDLLMEGSGVSIETIQEFMKAKEQEAKDYVPSERMQKFQKKYQEEGKTWAAFFRGVKRDPALMAELFVESLGTRVGTFFDSDEARLATAGGAAAGAGIGAAFGGIGAVPGAFTGMMGGLATSMEVALTFGELIEAELEKQGKEFTDKNIQELLQSKEGGSIRNRAIGRGLTIGAIEGLTGGIAGKVGKSVMKAAKGGKRGIVAAGTTGAAVEGVGGGAGEVLGRVAAGQEMDAAEIGFEAITGMVTTPGNVGLALLNNKEAKYYINNMKKPVTYEQMKQFVETADDIDIAKANLKIENDLTGLDALAYKKQQKARVDSQIDDKITDVNDRKELVRLEQERQLTQLEAEKKGINKVPGAAEKLATLEAEIESVISKYEGAVGIGETQTAKDVAKKVSENRISETIVFAEAAGKKIGKDVQVMDNDLSAQALYDKIAKENGLEAKDVTGADGYIVGDVIVINKDVAAKSGQINVGAHEVLHGVIAKHMKSLVKVDKNGKIIDNSKLKTFIDDFKKTLTKEQFDYIENVINERNKGDENLDINSTEEWLTIFSDGITKGDITFNEGVFDKLKNILQEILRKFGINKEFENGRQVYNFMKDYQKSVAKGELSKRAISLADGGTSADFSFSATPDAAVTQDSKQEIDELADGKVITQEMWDNQMGDFAQKTIQEEKLLDGLIASKYKVRPIPQDFVTKVYAELTRDFKRFKVAKYDESGNRLNDENGKPIGNDSLFGYLQGVIALRAGDVYNREYKGKDVTTVDATATTKEGAPVIQLAADEDVNVQNFEEEDMSIGARKQRRERVEVEQKSRAIRSHNVTQQDITDVKKEVEKAIVDPSLPMVDDFTWTQAFLEAAANKKSPIFKKIQKLVGTGDKFAQTLKDTRTTMFGKDGIPTSDLVQMEKMEVEKIFADFEYRATNQALIDEAVKLGLFKSFEIKTEKQGPAVYSKKMPTEKELLNFMGDYVTTTKKGKTTTKYVPKRGRRESYIILAAKLFTRDATFDVLSNKKIYDVFVKNNRDKGLPVSKNPLSVIKQRVDTDPEVMFSKSYGKADDASKIIFGEGLDTFQKNLVKHNYNVRKAFEDTYREKLFVVGKSKKLRNEIIADLERYVGYYKSYEGKVENVETTMEDYIALELTSPELTISDLRQAYGLSKKDIKFSNLDQIKSARVALLKLMQKLGKEKVLRHMKSLVEPTQLGNTDATATTLTQIEETGKLQKKIDRKNKQIKELKAKIKTLKAKNKSSKNEEGKLLRAKEKLKEYQSPDYKRRAGYGLIEDVNDFIVNFLNATNETNVDIVKRNNQDTKLIVNEEGVNFTKYQELEASAKADADFLIEMMDVLRELRNDKDANVSANDAAMIQMTLSNGMNTALASAAIPRYIPYVGKGQMYTGKMRWEHMIPRKIISLYLAEYQNSKISKDDIKFLLDNFHVSALPLHLDKLVTNTGLQAKMHAGWSIKDTNGNLSILAINDLKRYLNIRTYGKWDIPLFDLKEQKIEPKSLMFAENGTKFDADNVKERKVMSNAVQMSRTPKKPKGISILDFDDTLATSNSLIRYTRPDGTKGTLTPEQYASTYQDLQDLGYKFDFSEFNEVVDGKIAPLFQKALKLQSKFGSDNMFVLTARPAESAPAIFAFLQANGLNIPLKNITGLANSTSEAKALWIAEKVGEGYNDFYFADDALQNVQAVDNMLEQFDVKRKVQQAKINFSKSLDFEFNLILENITGIEAKKRFGATKARKRGADKGKFRLFIPPSHEDFVGLLYNFMGKGKEGDAHRTFFEQALVRPLLRAHREIDTAKQAVANDYKALNKQMSNVKDMLAKKTPDGDFTYQDAIRVYIWSKHGYKIPGLSPIDQKSLSEIVESDIELKTYADLVNEISKQETYVDPGPNWETGNIRIDLVDATGRVGRASYFAEFQENADTIFSEENLNKIEAAYGKDFREALEDMLHRIKTGVNRPKGSSSKPNMFMNWLNASVAGVMFMNVRSSLLQQMSNVNYLNFADNNILAAGKAFANQKQYWKDFAMIFNSDMMKQRRGGLQTDINGAELAEAIKKARPGNLFDQVAIITGKALRLGFLPTQIGDNIAIATGGAAFYRNRVNKYIKEGLSVKEAETKAFNDFQEITQSTQQSAKPYMTSAQQSSWIGKIVLNFLNTPSQYNRIIKKAASDIINRRITPPNTTQMQSDMSNMSRILYYGAAQNLIFYSLQTALFAVMFGDQDEDEEKRIEAYLTKKQRVIQGSIDTILRGSGIYGVALSTLKNMAIKFMEQREKGYNKDESAVIMEMLNFSPVVGIKARRIVNAEKTLNYNKKVIEQMETFDIDNPMWSAVTNYTQTITTVPTNKIYQKTINLRNAADRDYTALQRLLFLSGYTTWSLGLGDTKKMKEIKESTKSSSKKSKSRSRSVSRSVSRTTKI